MVRTLGYEALLDHRLTGVSLQPYGSPPAPPSCTMKYIHSTTTSSGSLYSTCTFQTYRQVVRWTTWKSGHSDCTVLPWLGRSMGVRCKLRAASHRNTHRAREREREGKTGGVGSAVDPGWSMTQDMLVKSISGWGSSNVAMIHLHYTKPSWLHQLLGLRMIHVDSTWCVHSRCRRWVWRHHLSEKLRECTSFNGGELRKGKRAASACACTSMSCRPFAAVREMR